MNTAANEKMPGNDPKASGRETVSVIEYLKEKTAKRLDFLNPASGLFLHALGDTG